MTNGESEKLKASSAGAIFVPARGHVLLRAADVLLYYAPPGQWSCNPAPGSTTTTQLPAYYPPRRRPDHQTFRCADARAVSAPRSL